MSQHAELDRLIAQWLDGIAPAVTEWLQKLLGGMLPEGTELLDCEFHGSEIGRGPFPVVIYPMDLDAGQVEMKHFTADEIEGLSPSIASDSRWENEVWDAVAEALFPWFADRWVEAGGPASIWPAYIAEHDDDRSFNLNTKKWIRDDEKWE